MAGRRALFHSDWSGIDPKALPDNFLAIGDTPHDWLFPKPDMGLAPGGQMRQQIDEDHFGFEAFDCNHSSHCFVHLCNSLVWQSVPGQLPPYPPPTAKRYSKAGLPWFDYYRDDVEAVPGSNTPAQLKSVSQISLTKGDHALPENEPFTLSPTQIRQVGKGRPVREMK